MKKLLFIAIVTLLVSCSNNDEPDRLMYDVTYTVTANNGATINKVEYLDSQGVLIEVNNVSSPWSINLRLRAGLALDVVTFGDIPFQGNLMIKAEWTPEGGLLKAEEQSVGNDTPNSTLNNVELRIPGRTLLD
jgi:hypothetical protein